MGIVSRTGDKGTTALLFGRRVPKHHVRIEALGSVEELSAALGFAKVALTDSTRVGFLGGVQLDLIAMMGELSIDPVDRQRPPPFLSLGDEALEELDAWVDKLEPTIPASRKWDISGINEPHARLHLARAVCRRAERAIWAVVTEDADFRHLHGRYLNRLSDVLWLLAREASSSDEAKSADRAA